MAVMRAEQKISKEDTRSIYAIGAVLGLVESGNKNDLLHLFVEGMTGKDSISSLTASEARSVLFALRKKNTSNMPKSSKSSKKPPAVQIPGKMSVAQQKQVWRLMYDLNEVDPSETNTLGERLCAIIKKQYKVEANPKNPFAWLSAEQGSGLIETLKKIVVNTYKRKRK